MRVYTVAFSCLLIFGCQNESSKLLESDASSDISHDVTTIDSLGDIVISSDSNHEDSSKDDFAVQDDGMNNADFVAKYYYTSEVLYEKILVTRTEIKYTYFEDTTNKCSKWVKSAPCWSVNDLKTTKHLLSSIEVSHLIDTIKLTGFMSLNASYGGAGQSQRFYPVELSASEGTNSHKVIYQSFSEADPMPKAFVDTFKLLFELVCQKLSKRTMGPFPSQGWQC